jgi:hypothetical protein
MAKPNLKAVEPATTATDENRRRLAAAIAKRDEAMRVVAATEEAIQATWAEDAALTQKLESAKKEVVAAAERAVTDRIDIKLGKTPAKGITSDQAKANVVAAEWTMGKRLRFAVRAAGMTQSEWSAISVAAPSTAPDRARCCSHWIQRVSDDWEPTAQGPAGRSRN